MATVDEIAKLRRLVAEPTQNTYTDAALTAVIDGADSLNAAALEIWTEKAASYVALVDISEGGSQRKNSDLLEHAQAMIAMFTDLVASAGVTRIARLSR